MLGFLILLAFEQYRDKGSLYGKRVARLNDRTPGGKAAPYGFLKWVKEINSLKEKEVARLIGLDAYMLLRFTRICRNICFFGVFWGCVILCPIYYTGENTDDAEGFYRLTLANVVQSSNRLWAPVVYMYVFSLYFMFLLHKEFARFIKLRAKFFQEGDPSFSPQTRYSVMVEGIPPACRSSPALKEFFESLFPNNVHSAHVCLRIDDLEHAVSERQEVCERLEKDIARRIGDGRVKKVFVKKIGEGKEGAEDVDFDDQEEEEEDEYDVERRYSSENLLAYDEHKERVDREKMKEGDQDKEEEAIWRDPGLLDKCWRRGGEDEIDSIKFLSEYLSFLNMKIAKLQRKYVLEAEAINLEAQSNIDNSRSARFIGGFMDGVGSSMNKHVLSKIGLGGGKQSNGDQSEDLDDEDTIQTSLIENDHLSVINEDEEGYGSINNASKTEEEEEEKEIEIEETNKKGKKKKKNKNLKKGMDKVEDVAGDLASGIGNVAKNVGKDFKKQFKLVTGGVLFGATEVTKQLEMLTFGADYRMSDTGIVTFTSLVSSASSYQMLLVPEANAMDVSPAPSAEDIIWENIATPRSQTAIRRTVGSLIVGGGAIFWSVIVATITAWSSVDNLSKSLPFLKSMEGGYMYTLLGGYLPVLALLGLLNILPILFRYLSEKYEGVKRHSEVDLTVMSRLFLYQMANIFITITAGSIFDALHDIINDPTSILALLGSSLPTVSTYFGSLLVTKAFTGLPIELLRPGPFLQVWYAQKCTKKEKLSERERKRFVYKFLCDQ